MIERRNKVSEYSNVVIVGAGPAGLNAAFQLAEYRVKCTLIDENSRVGGVIYRGPFRNDALSPHLSPQLKETIETTRKKLSLYVNYIHLILQTRVLGMMKKDVELALLNTQNRLFPYHYQKLILSTGCYEKTVPFPGWTLPGVMSVGGAHLQVKNGLVRPGKDIVLVGTGPLLLVAAKQLHQAGVKVHGVYEAGRRSQLIGKLYSLAKNIPLLLEGIGIIRTLKKEGIPIHYGWGIVEARGGEELSEVVVAPYNQNWIPQQEHARTIKTEVLGVGYGFIPRHELAQLLEVERKFIPGEGYRLDADNWMRTSKKHIYVAGDSVGILGAQVAAEQGKLAAFAYLMDIKRITPGEALKKTNPIRKKIRRLQSFQEAFHQFSYPREGLLELPNGDTPICRCENITRNQLDAAIQQGVQDIVTLKMSTRIAMGNCQGKLCADYCYRFLRKEQGKEDVGELRPRFPLSMVPFSAVLAGREEK